MLDDTDDIHPLFHGAPKGLEFRKLRKRLVGQVREAIDTYGMAKAGDRWLVCLSGGKDSYTLLAILHELKWRGLLPVELLACNLDQGQPGFPATVLPDFLTKMGVPHRIEYQDTYSVVIDKIKPGGTMCSLCSRLRRGNLYRVAREEGCSTVILGHHRDDILETLFLNLFHGGKLKAMPPKLLSDDGQHVVIRPLAYCREHDLAAYAEVRQFPLIPCNLCGSQPHLQRQAIKAMLRQWEKQFPGRVENIFAALQNVAPSHLADAGLFDFAGLGSGAGGRALNWLPGGCGEAEEEQEDEEVIGSVTAVSLAEIRVPIPPVRQV